MSVQGLNFGIDFEGGTRITAALSKPATVDQVRNILAQPGPGDAEVQTIIEQASSGATSSRSRGGARQGRRRRGQNALRERFGFADNPSAQRSAPSFGQTVAKSAIDAIIASLIVISLYITLRFQWKFAVPVMIALAHDLLITAASTHSSAGR